MSQPMVPLRVTVLWIVVAVSAFMVLLWPLDLLTVSSALRFSCAVAAGVAAGFVLSRVAWRQGR